MKNFTLLMSAMLLGCGTAYGQQTLSNRAKQNRVKSVVMSHFLNQRADVKLADKKMNRTPVVKAKGDKLWRPTHDKFYLYDEAGKDWLFKSEGNYTYYDTGLLKQSKLFEEGEYSIRDYKYNENYQLTSFIHKRSYDDQEYEPKQKNVFAYDEILKTLPIKNEQYYYDNAFGIWVMETGSTRRVIKRNEKGNMTSSVVEVYSQGEYFPQKTSLFFYNKNNDAPDAYQFFERDAPEPSNELKNIVWERFNGQPAEEVYDLYFGNCRIATADVVMGGSVVGTMKVTYNGEDFESCETYPQDGTQVKVLYKKYDANGSNSMEEFDYYDNNGDGIFTDDEIIFQTKVDVKFDDHKNKIFDGYYETVPGLEYLLCDGQKDDYTYDAATGCVSEKIHYFFKPEYDADNMVSGGTFVYDTKLVNDKFEMVGIDNAIGGVEAEKAEILRNGNVVSVSAQNLMSCTLYDVQGRMLQQVMAQNGRAQIHMESFSVGTYILKVQSAQGSQTIKIMR